MDFEATPPPIPETAKKRAKKTAEKPKRAKKEPEGFTRVKPFKPDANQVASAEFMMAQHAEDLSGDVEEDTSDDVKEALGSVREMAKERADEDAAWDAKIAEAKKKADEEGQVIEFEAEPQSEAERKEAEEPYAEISIEHPKEPAFTEHEEAWFKKGEEEEMDAIRAGIEAHGDAPMIETPAEIDANVRQAEAMIAAGDLNAEMFNAKDYRYLLSEKARIDADLEVAGWWQARKLRAELKEIVRDLTGYEDQIQGVMNGRKGSGAMTAREKEDVRYKGPMAKQALPQGTGTTIHKAGFFSRLFGKK